MSDKNEAAFPQELAVHCSLSGLNQNTSPGSYMSLHVLTCPSLLPQLLRNLGSVVYIQHLFPRKSSFNEVFAEAKHREFTNLRLFGVSLRPARKSKATSEENLRQGVPWVQHTAPV